jgi:hypothetical protein
VTRQFGLTLATGVLFMAYLAAQEPAAPAKGKEAAKQEAAKQPAVPDGWTLFSSAEGKCQILFPGKPSTMRVERGQQAILAIQNGKAGYLLGFSSIPGGVPPDNKEIADRILAAIGEKLVKQTNGSKILKETPTTIAGHPAREIDTELEGAVGRWQLVLSPQISYWIVTFGPGDFVDSADAKKFRESFKINPDAKDSPEAVAKGGPDAKGNPDAKPITPDEAEKIVARLHVEFEDAGTKLEKPETGEKTQTVQQQIIDDLEKLIKQQNDKNNQSNSSQQGGSPMAQDGQPMGQSGQPMGSKGEAGNSKGNPMGSKGEAGNSKGNPMGSQGQGKDKGLAKKEPMGSQKGEGDKKDQSAKKGDGGKIPGGKGSDSPKNNVVNDELKKGLWGELPNQKRQELNALAGDRMIPRYEELLRQYYRTIAEQGRKKEGD